MAITPLPSPPLVTDDTATFNAKAFAWVAGIDTWTTEANSTASNVSTLESQAASSASAASTSASNALTSANNSANSASAASTSASNALASANSAAASFDSFDDRYLGSKTSDPALDNDGNALLTGALYWNSVSNTMKVYSGSAWIDAYVPSTDYVQKAGDTMTGALVVNTNSSSDAIRITQTGSGNALVVEDSANPDSTPFVVAANGNVIVGNTTDSSSILGSKINVDGTLADAGIQFTRYSANASGPAIVSAKSRGASIGTRGAVSNNDVVGQLLFYGDDSSNWVLSSSIRVEVDGTPGTNDMPGRLVFSTTADGASSPTERMRIRSDGGIGIGGAGFTTVGLTNQKNIEGGTTAYANYTLSSVQSGVTSNAYGSRNQIGTAASSFTLTNLETFSATQGVFGAGSTVTNQFGFSANSNLTGATNNYGFYSNIASGTGRYNFYAAGSAPNYFAGNVGIGTTTSSGTLTVAGSIGLSQASTQDRNIEIGIGRTGNGNSYVDLIGDTTYTDYGARFFRNGGANGATLLTHRGTGSLDIKTEDSAPVVITTNNVEVLRAKATGAVRFQPLASDPSSPTTGDVYYNSSSNKLKVYNGTSWVDLH